MSNPIKVNFGGLSAAAGDISGSAGALVARLDRLETDLAPMVATWDGEAAQFYRAKQRQWDTAAAELTEVLRQIGVAVGAAGQNYAQVERQISSSWA